MIWMVVIRDARWRSENEPNNDNKERKLINDRGCLNIQISFFQNICLSDWDYLHPDFSFDIYLPCLIETNRLRRSGKNWSIVSSVYRSMNDIRCYSRPISQVRHWRGFDQILMEMKTQRFMSVNTVYCHTNTNTTASLFGYFERSV